VRADRPMPRVTSGRDPLTPEQRRLNMSRVRGKDTKPELLLRRGLHASGLRYRLHGAKLPGRPDLVFAGARAVIFVHGCFWHGHDCPLFRLPGTRTEFWASKIEANRVRDSAAVQALRSDNWRVLLVWECAIRGPARHQISDLTSEVRSFLQGEAEFGEVEGTWGRAKD
jgi:DNA mismatch endonuclease (patch repair protein)